MIATVASASNSISSHNYYFFFMMGVIKIYFSKSDDHNALWLSICKLPSIIYLSIIYLSTISILLGQCLKHSKY